MILLHNYKVRTILNYSPPWYGSTLRSLDAIFVYKPIGLDAGTLSRAMLSWQIFTKTTIGTSITN